MGLRDSFSRLKKKVKHLGSQRKPGRPGTDVGGESADSENSFLGPEPHVVSGDAEGIGADGEQVSSTDQPPQPDEPESVPAGGGENKRGEEEDIEGMEVGRRYSHLDSDFEAVVGGRPGQEGGDVDGGEDERFYSCSSTPSTPRGGDPDGAWMWLCSLLPLIIPQAI